MDPACRPHSMQRSAADSFGWPWDPSFGSSGSWRNSGCPLGRTWDVHQEAAAAPWNHGDWIKGWWPETSYHPDVWSRPITLEWLDIPRCYTRPKLIFALLVTRLSQECDTRPELKSTNWHVTCLESSGWFQHRESIIHCRLGLGWPLKGFEKHINKHLPWTPRKWFSVENSPLLL